MTASIDTAELSNLKEVMEDEFEMLISIYLEDTESMIQKMADAIRSGDIDALKIASHTLKGSSSNMFILRISQLSKDIEDKAKANELDSALQVIPELEQEFQKVKTLLAEF